MTQTPDVSIGVIGGSGIYELAGVEGIEEISLDTPFGVPSDVYRVGKVGSKRVAFLARHGQGHQKLPNEINYRANIYGFKLLGVSRLLSASAVGSLKQEIAPRDVVVPDQFVDRTKQRVSTFFGDGLAAHVSFADPVCHELADIFYKASKEQGAKAHFGGTYLCMEGPAFSTRAESNLYRSWGMDIIGMTNLTEAKLAREAEICYSTLALVTDYDCWKEDEAAVSVEAVIATLTANAALASRILKSAIEKTTIDRKCACGEALRYALITAPEAVDAHTLEKLTPIVGKYLEHSNTTATE